eukprot:1158031-Pelagomonas_calceolata.AAC.6
MLVLQRCGHEVSIHIQRHSARAAGCSPACGVSSGVVVLIKSHELKKWTLFCLEETINLNYSTFAIVALCMHSVWATVPTSEYGDDFVKPYIRWADENHVVLVCANVTAAFTGLKSCIPLLIALECLSWDCSFHCPQFTGLKSCIPLLIALEWLSWDCSFHWSQAMHPIAHCTLMASLKLQLPSIALEIVI